MLLVALDKGDEALSPVLHTYLSTILNVATIDAALNGQIVPQDFMKKAPVPILSRHDQQNADKEDVARLMVRSRVFKAMFFSENPLPEELIEGQSVGLLAEDWYTAPSGSFIISLTDGNSYAYLIFRNIVVDFATYDVSFEHHEEPAVPAMTLMASNGMDADTKFIIDCAFTFAEIAAFAIPQGGVAIAAGVSVMHMIFDKCMPVDKPKHISQTKVLIGAMEVLFKDLELHDAVDTIKGESEWFNMKWEVHEHREEPLSDREQEEYLKDLLRITGSTSDLWKAKATLSNGRNEIWGLYGYLIASTLHSTLYKVLMLLDGSKDEDRKWYYTVHLDEQITVLERDIAHLDHAYTRVRTRFNDRLKGVSPPFEATVTTEKHICREGNCWIGTQEVPCVRVTDTMHPEGRKEYNFFDDQGGCKGGGTKAMDKAKKFRDSHVVNVIRDTERELRFHIDDIEHFKESIDKLREVKVKSEGYRNKRT